MGTYMAGGLVSPVGIEPTTNWLKANCSTTELRARNLNERNPRGVLEGFARYHATCGTGEASTLLPFHPRLSIVQRPMTMNPAPAISFSVDGFTNRSSCAPTSTPMAEARTSALALAAKTSHLLFCASEAKSIVASCVLSPISARKTEMKMAEKALIMVGRSVWRRYGAHVDQSRESPHTDAGWRHAG